MKKNNFRPANSQNSAPNFNFSNLSNPTPNQNGTLEDEINKYSHM